MDFASAYLASNSSNEKLFTDIPAKNTGIIIVIPAFDEPGIIFTLESLAKCNAPPCNVEVIIIINAPSWAERAQIEQNNITLNDLSVWKQGGKDTFMNLLYHNAGVQDNRHWGVGMARKMGMDEALSRFGEIKKPDGIIASLDADCLVEKNYLEELYDKLYLRSENKACSIYFEHPLAGELNEDIYEAIARYELHLRYYYQALKYAGFPWVYQTVGSAIAVKAGTYARAGGMNKRQGGEDFYFIQKLIPAGGYFYLNTTTVIPSPRISGRVPFGTGPVVGKMTPDIDYLTFNPSGFEYLKKLFDNVMMLYHDKDGLMEELYGMLHHSLRNFLDINNWHSRIREIRNNTSSPDSFKKRFFNWFNMFRAVKYLNFLHSGEYIQKIPVQYAAADLLNKLGIEEQPVNTVKLLRKYRKMER